MKKISKFLIAFVSVLTVACNADDVDSRPILSGTAIPEVLTPKTDDAFILLEEDATKEASMFSWSAAEYSAAVPVDYTVLMDKQGGDFTAPITLATTKNALTTSVSVKQLNQSAIDLGGKPDEAASFDIMIRSKVATGALLQSTKVATITVTPYSGKVAYDFEEWYLVGNATVSGWDNNKGNQILFRSATDPKEYKFTGYFTAGAFKTIKDLGSWIPMYGGEKGALAYRGTDADADPVSFVIATSGYYTFTMNIETLKYSLVAYNATAAPAYTTIGIIGSSTPKGWDASTAMVQSTFDKHIWSLGITSLKEGELKFRANDSWDVAWGATTAFSGMSSNAAGSANIPVAKSKYVVYFNDLDGSYLMIPNQG
ncbi:SusE domain-containing protein [Flavobacterium frigidarium]|uniref:SusE domain-containing protein n=1 Tax=Flavobacterium frigidarium TaxID=99286 RepID=UPI0030DD3780|tara:strand:- start:2359 stop:3468 length:1110 start_codon:yes stop_codon:yes gene_type:complete